MEPSVYEMLLRPGVLRHTEQRGSAGCQPHWIVSVLIMQILPRDWKASRRVKQKPPTIPQGTGPPSTYPNSLPLIPAGLLGVAGRIFNQVWPCSLGALLSLQPGACTCVSPRLVLGLILGCSVDTESLVWLVLLAILL